MGYTYRVHRIRAIAVLTLLCVAAAACSTSPKAAPTGWSRLDPYFPVAPFSTLLGASCASPTVCVAVGTTGPTAWWGQYGDGVGVFDGHVWVDDDFPNDVGRPRCVGPGLCAGTGKGVRLVSCVPPHFCMAIDTVSESWVYDGRSWHEIPLPFGISPKIYQFTAAELSCATPRFCMVIGGLGVFDTFNGTSWGVPKAFSSPTSFSSPGGSSSFWCATAHHCVLYGNTQNYVYDGTSWAVHAHGPPGSIGACPQREDCLFSNGFVVPPQPHFQGSDVDQVSCVSRVFCMSFDDDTSVTYRYDGVRWVPAGKLRGATGSDFLNCVSPSFCEVIDSSGYIWTWH